MKVKFNRDQKMLYLILLPFIIWYAVFMFKPMYGMVIAFKDYSLFRGISGSEWVGLKNFKDFLTSPEFYVTLKNTLMLNYINTDIPTVYTVKRTMKSLQYS